MVHSAGTERDPEVAVGGAVAAVSEEGEAGLRNKSFMTFTDISKMWSSCFCALLMRGSEASAVITSISFLSSESSLLVLLVQVDEVDVTNVILEVSIFFMYRDETCLELC